MGRVVILSDIHISPTHGFFWENGCLARDFANSAAAEAVIVNGDLTINGPDSDEEVKFAALAIKSLRGPVLPLPGNHDIGDEPPGQDPDQIVNTQRLARWDSFLGADRWMMDTEGWRLIGVNAQLFGSSLRREDEQNRWLEEQLIAATGRSIALFLHKPLFLDDLNEGPASVACIVPGARARLVDMLRERGVSLVVSGHLHQYRDRTINGLRHLWLPAVAFAAAQSLGGDGRCGLTVLDFSQRGVEITIERPEGMVSHDLAAIKGHGRYPFLRDMPPSPVVLTD